MPHPIHGAFDYAELQRLGLEPSQISDFSSNVNPLGTPKFIHAALTNINLAQYPDRQCLALRAALANQHACDPTQILIGNGSNELIHLVARALIQVNDYVLLIEPTFGEYAYASSLVGAQLIRYQASAESGFQVDVAACCQLIAQYRPRLVWLCNPNNPTGSALNAQAIQQLQAACAAVEGYLVLDLAYADLVVAGQDLGVRGWKSESYEAQFADSSPLAPTPYTLQLYSLTKSYALAGLRLGYVMAQPSIIQALQRWQPQWSVNSLAQAAGLAIMANPAWLAHNLGQWWDWSEQLQVGLSQLGLRVLPSCLPFFLVEVQNAQQTRSALLQHACLVRDCSSFGLPQFVRIAPRQPQENQRLIAAWRTLC